ncbi:MAG: metal ABC transporter ATP-binding protein [Candidatus Adiutrix sp.]
MNIHSAYPLPFGPWAIEIKNLSVTFGHHQALSSVCAQVPKGGQTVIIGPNGGGKTTLVKSILGQVPTLGQIIFEKNAPIIGYVPQGLDFDRQMPLTVLEFLSLGLCDFPLWLGAKAKLHPQIIDLLTTVKAAHLINHRLGALSGGELQRVLLASALSLKPEILIMDEPATGVDVYGEQLICELLDSFKTHFTILMVSHDLPTAKAHADWVICLNRRVIAQGPPEAIFNSPAIAATFGLHSHFKK